MYFNVILTKTVNFWLSTSEATSTVTVEYELTKEDLHLKKLEIRIPIPYVNSCILYFFLHDLVILIQPRPSCSPKLNSDNSTCKYDRDNEVIVWLVEAEKSLESSDMLEFTIDADDPDLLFPMNISFVGYCSYCGVKVCMHPIFTFIISGPDVICLHFFIGK